MSTLSNNLGAKMRKNEEDVFVCELCHYKCSKKFNLDRHFLSNKHIKTTFDNLNTTKNEENEKNEENQKKYCCEKCGKEYNDRTGLWRHKKVCKINDKIKENNVEDKNNKLIEYLMKENKEIKEMILEIVKNGTMNNDKNEKIITNISKVTTIKQ
jgi:hypothetical protein